MWCVCVCQCMGLCPLSTAARPFACVSPPLHRRPPLCLPPRHPLPTLPLVQVPFVAQAFANGNHCDRDPDPATGAARPPVARTTELRFLCSPDAEYHLTVAEPDQCSYVVELYLPTLCALPGFAVEAPPGGWLAASHDDTDSTRGAGMGDLGPQYALPQDLGEDDPYADPDDNAAGHGEL